MIRYFLRNTGLIQNKRGTSSIGRGTPFRFYFYCSLFLRQRIGNKRLYGRFHTSLISSGYPDTEYLPINLHTAEPIAHFSVLSECHSYFDDYIIFFDLKLI